MKPITFERDAKLYIVAPVTPTHPSEQDIEEYAFSKSIIAEHRQRAPNENLAWFSGHYVEADKPNLNGAMWLSDELAIKSLTPMLMPVTVMHDPSSAVGLIADIALREPGYKGVANSRIESVLALWRHRFPEAVEEAEHNYTAGTLSQSMECVPLDTEILTRRGWRQWDEVRPGFDETVGYNPATGRNEWTPINDIVRKRATVMKAHTPGGRWTARCTEGHRWATKIGKRVGTKQVFDGFEMAELRDLGHRHQLRLSALADLEAPEGDLPITPSEAAVIAWIAGDGSGSHRGAKDFQATVYQNKPDGMMAIEMALHDAGLEYTTKVSEPKESTLASGKTVTTRRPTTKYHFQAAQIREVWLRAGLDHLSWTSFVMRLSGACRAAFMEAMDQAEGHDNHGSRCITQMLGPLKDAIALGGYLEGYRPVSHEGPGGDNSLGFSHVRLVDYPVNGDNLRYEPLGEDEVWCPQTGLGTWTMRQDDKVMLTGNCVLSGYNCGECGQLFHRLPDRAEEANWCDHLKAPGATRILRDVTFTGTGLIFGSRGAEPGDPSADLESFQSEVAEFHQRTQTDGTRSRRSTPKMDEITLARSEYDRIVKERDDAVARAQTVASERDTAAEAQKAAEREQEAAETAKVQAETKVTELEGKVNLAEEAARQGKLADERFDALGAGFTAKLGEKTKTRLKAQASALSDDEWSERLDELEEMAGVKRDEGGESTDDSDGKTFTDEEVARSKTGTSTNEPTEPSVTMRRSVIQGLLTKS